MKKNFKNILIFGHSNIGDVCYDSAVVSPLRQEFPQARISFITSDRAQAVASAISGIDEVIVFDKQSAYKGFPGYLKFILSIRRRKFDAAVILRGQMHYFFGIPACVAHLKNTSSDDAEHVAWQHVRLLERIGIKDVTPRFNFSFSKEEKEFALKYLNPAKEVNPPHSVGIMPFSAWKLKCWPVEKWNEIIDFLSGRYGAAVFILGKTDGHPFEKDFMRKISPKAISLVDKCGLRQSLAVIKELDLFIGTDTSLLHFASCMAVPSIGLFGPSNHKVFYPFFHRELMIVSQAEMPCIPCFNAKEVGYCGVKDAPGPCMVDISTEMVMEKINLAWKNRSSR